MKIEGACHPVISVCPFNGPPGEAVVLLSFFTVTVFHAGFMVKCFWRKLYIGAMKNTVAGFQKHFEPLIL